MLLIVTLNDLEIVVLTESVTETVNEYVVFSDKDGAVPEITPVEVFNERPLGREPVVIANVNALFSGSVASADIDTEEPSLKDPKDPEEYCHTGDWLIYSASGINPNKFDGFVTLISNGSYAAFSPVNTAVNCTNELYVVVVACVSTPFVPIAEAIAPFTKFVPDIIIVPEPLDSLYVPVILATPGVSWTIFCQPLFV